MRPSTPPTVAFVSLPLHWCLGPPIGVGILQSVLRREGIESRIYNLNLDFLRFVDPDPARALGLYEELSDLFSLLPGEWLFSPADSERDRTYLDRLRADGVSPSIRDLLVRLRPLVPEYLASVADRVVGGGHDVVGFTTSFMQTRPSVALAKILKERAPATRIAFGGANVFGPPGRALLESFPDVDLVCHGEAEEAIAPIVRFLRGEPGAGPETLAGVTFRDGDRIVDRTEGGAAPRMDEIPVPDFSDWFEDLARVESELGADLGLPVWLPVETARGCWWGAKKHCTFCGLNADRMAFRSKSPERVLAELEELRGRYGRARFCVVDNILDHRYFETVLPSLGRRRDGYEFHWEVKSNLGRRHVATLAAAGVTMVQPGIESLSTPALALMRKGVTCLQNVQTLKWCEEFGIEVNWNHLYRFPGDRLEWYEAVARAAPLLEHLPPPQGCYPVAVHRFSPYHTTPAEFGVRLEGPTFHYRMVFPDVAPERLAGFAYLFDSTIEGRDPAIDAFFLATVRPLLNGWRRRYEERGCTLSIVHGPEESLLVRGSLERPDRVERVRGALRWLLRRAEEIRPVRDLEAGERAGLSGNPPETLSARLYDRTVAGLARRAGAPGSLDSPPSARGALDLAEELGLVLREGDRALGLAVDRTRRGRGPPFQYGLHLEGFEASRARPARIGA